jgi:tetratricopeptide (TPR) repeat protein
VQAGGDRKLLVEAERASAEKISQALDLWRAAGDFDRLLAGAEELSRIYVGLNDYEGAISCLTRESEFWLARGDTARQVHMVWLTGIRQMQMRRPEAAIKTLEQAVEMSRAANLISVEIKRRCESGIIL